MNKSLKPLLIAALVFSIAACSAEESLPAPVQALVDRGVVIEHEFDTAGMKGYVARAGGQSTILYLAPDEQHILIGNLLTADGTNLSAEYLERFAPPPEFNEAWDDLAASTWIGDGNPDADRIVYMFTDPNCPYCHKFWQAARPYVGNDVQLRHVMVGILGPTSAGKAAALLSANDPRAALLDHEENYESGGVEPLASVAAETQQKLRTNRELMQKLGSGATPTIFYKDADGQVRRIIGLPQSEEKMKQIFHGVPRD